MKNFILITLFIISILILIAEPEILTFKIVLFKILSLIYAIIFLKANFIDKGGK